MTDSIDTDETALPLGTDPNDREYSFQPVNPVAESLTRIADFSERQREKHAPIFVELTNSSPGPISFHHRLRMIGFICACSTAGDHITLSFGGRTFDFLFAVGTFFVPFPYEVDRGIDIVLANVTSANHATYMQIISYTE